MYAFLRRPRYVLFTIAIVAVVIAMVNLGLWQLRRLDERRDLNETVRAHLAEPARAVDEVLAADAGRDVARSTEWTIVTASGTYDDSEQVVVRNRSFRGQPGVHVLTPLVLADGSAVVVNRGWIPLASE